MDHLPQWTGSHITPFRVPLVCDITDVEFTTFDEYQDQHHFDYNNVLKQASNVNELESAAKHLQKWLYFGLIQNVSKKLGINIDLQTFVTEQSERHYITSKSLSQFMTDLVLAKVPGHYGLLRKLPTHSAASWHRLSIKVPHPDDCVEKTHSVVSAFISRIDGLE